ncbi:hypothetical protein [Lachnotalea glycerini]|uniref:Uncharacterized protein n=1 Tax=Lachnotalea glycerini TaxID=1763509 RepID=A0A371J515_9FIRM|nr:hypothetical protein [Lachnotalea glycerini]RDY27784.1 hypothetical protein CG710_020335 [Lachnotalea glycerini]
MDYFELFQSEKVENAVELMGLDSSQYPYAMTKGDFEVLDKLKVAYYSGRETEEMCDILKEPTCLISNEIKRLFKLYDRSLEYKGVQLFSTASENTTSPLYWVAGFPIIDCLHESSQKYGNGMLKELILDKKKIRGLNIFRVAGLLEHKVIVTLPVAESILRRRLYGIGLRRVKVV